MAAACTSWRSSRRSSAPHRITTTARRDGDDWILNGAKTYISGVDVASNVLVVARTEDSTTGALKPVLFVVPTGAAGLEYTKIEMDIISADRQFSVFLDDVRLPADALVGAEDAAIDQLFAGLNPERIMASAFAVGMARYARGWPPSTRRSGWCGATNRSDPIKALRTRSRRPTSRCNWRS
nr:acyl-CoA dehydrogenase family protein [Candidatus Microthrix sp.]